MISEQDANGELPKLVDVSSSDLQAIGDFARQLINEDWRDLDSAEWVARTRLAALDLPGSLRRSLARFGRHSGASGALVLSGLPIDPQSLPPTPRFEQSAPQVPTVPACQLMLISALLGEVMSFRAEKDGHLVQDVVPVSGSELSQGNMGSATLSFHTEYPFYHIRPDFLALLCLRSDHGHIATFRVSSIREVLPLLDRAEKDALFAPEYESVPPPLFNYRPTRALRHTVLSGASEDPDLRIDTAVTRPLTERAAMALSRLEQLMNKTARGIRLQPGDLVIVDNRIAAHGRTAFEPVYDGNDRWLQRAFVIVDLRPSRVYRHGDGQVLAR